MSIESEAKIFLKNLKENNVPKEAMIQFTEVMIYLARMNNEILLVARGAVKIIIKHGLQKEATALINKLNKIKGEN